LIGELLLIFERDLVRVEKRDLGIAKKNKKQLGYFVYLIGLVKLKKFLSKHEDKHFLRIPSLNPHQRINQVKIPNFQP
ncbi:hypothetical protein, partial [Anabaena sp. PCC 7938]|uniref:hypothetical protein n=1 Tax=Anabaena sp. PCC 7938 TaxID=1296340 RepID=UPI0020304EFB